MMMTMMIRFVDKKKTFLFLFLFFWAMFYNFIFMYFCCFIFVLKIHNSIFVFIIIIILTIILRIIYSLVVVHVSNFYRLFCFYVLKAVLRNKSAIWALCIVDKNNWLQYIFFSLITKLNSSLISWFFSFFLLLSFFSYFHLFFLFCSFILFWKLFFDFIYFLILFLVWWCAWNFERKQSNK